MSAPTDQLTETVTRAQEAVTAAVRTWTDTVLSSLSSVQALPDATAVVDRYFEIAQQVLDTQREFARSVLNTGLNTGLHTGATTPPAEKA